MFPNEFRICFPDKNIFICSDHNWAFAAWEINKRSGKIRPNATLFHVDAHLDDVWDGLEVRGLQEMVKYNDVLDVAEKMKVDNFIWPAVETGTVDKVIYVSQYSFIRDPFDFKDWDLTLPEMEQVKWLLENDKYSGLRYWSIEELLENQETLRVKALTDGTDLILDLDLDYFAEEDVDSATIRLMNEQKILENLRSLRDSFNWSLITVAISPFYCGGDDNATYLLGLFCKVFDLNIEESNKW